MLKQLLEASRTKIVLAVALMVANGIGIWWADTLLGRCYVGIDITQNKECFSVGKIVLMWTIILFNWPTTYIPMIGYACLSEGMMGGKYTETIVTTAIIFVSIIYYYCVASIIIALAKRLRLRK